MQRRIPFITYIIVAINIAIFVLETLAGGSLNQEVALKFGAMYVPFVKNGEIYRMFTAMFLHFGVTHILMNMISLINIGPVIEMVYGKIRYLIVYLVSGICGNILVFITESSSGRYALNAGASGAIFGVLGACVALAMSKNFRNMFNLRRVLISVVIALAPGFYIQGISLTAHIGGLIGGFVIALILLPTIGPKKNGKRQVEKQQYGKVIYYGNSKPKDR